MNTLEAPSGLGWGAGGTGEVVLVVAAGGRGVVGGGIEAVAGGARWLELDAQPDRAGTEVRAAVMAIIRTTDLIPESWQTDLAMQARVRREKL